ncbi:hypothetical protein L9F63_004755, partial [Diploptera punctata]
VTSSHNSPDPATHSPTILRLICSSKLSKNYRGPRSPPPSPPPRMSISISPERKHERSPSSWRGRAHWERSPSPRRRNSREMSPPRRYWRSSSRDRGSPSRRSRRERSLSPRGRHRRSREWSSSPRRERSHDISDRRDRSLSPRGRHTSFSPPHRSSSRDGSWRNSPGRMPPPPCFSQMPPPQQQSYEVLPPPPQPPNLYSEGNYTGSAQPASYVGPPPPTSASTQPPPPPPPPGYSNYQQYGYDNYYQQHPPPAPNSYSGEYGPPGIPPASWSDGRMVYPDISQPPPVQVPGTSGNQAPGTSVMGGPVDQKSEEAKKEAVKNELIQQKQTLSKQREEYVRKKTLIARELELLKEQEEDLLEEHSRDNDRILKENHKLQLEIQNKLKAINNVIDMLTGIIGDKDQLDDKRKASHKDSDKKKPKTPPETPPHSSESELEGKGDEENSKHSSKDKPVYNYVYYDPEMHWCRVCDVFPRTAKEYLNHLHSTEHKEVTLERKLVDMPWHKNMPDQEVPHIASASTKRTPIRGLQFFISATAWYCKMCDVWIGDLHCASLHLKSKRHSENYAKFTEQNPHWETDWLADRERAYERCAEERRRMKSEKEAMTSEMEQASSSGKHLLEYPLNIKPEAKEEKPEVKAKKKIKEQHKKIKKNCVTALDESKKKKYHKKKQRSKKSHNSPYSSSSSSSSSDSSSSSSSSDERDNLENEDKSKSIRVAMRNKIKDSHQEHVQSRQIPLLPRSRWDSPPEEKAEEIGKGKSEWMRDEHGSKFKQPSGDDKLIREWMSLSKEVTDGEKQLLNSIKDRLRQKQEADKEKEREKRDDRRDSRRSKRQSESPSSPSYRSKKSRSDKSPDERRDRSSRFDRYERHEQAHRSPERPSRRDSSLKSDQKFKEEPDVKLPDRKSELEKKVLAKYDEEEDYDEESAESKFEKQTAESAAKLMKKAKKPPVVTIPKSKLPFIGRMPILKHFAKKKKPDETKSENEDKKDAPEDPLVQAQYKLEFTNVGGKVHIGPQESIGPELPPTEQVQDMDIDEDTSNSDVAPPVIETSVTVEPEPPVQSSSPKKPLTDIPLPKDFQDALNILFPGQETTEKKEESNANPPGVIQSGPKPPSNQQQQQQGHWPPMGGPPMMPPPIQGYSGSPQGPSQMMGPPMMGPVHGLHGPPPPSHMPGPRGMFGPSYGMPGPPGSMMNPQNVPHHPPPPILRGSEPPVRHPPPPPRKVNRPASKAVTQKKETYVKKSDVAGEMSAAELAMLGIDVGDMAAQSF